MRPCRLFGGLLFLSLTVLGSLPEAGAKMTLKLATVTPPHHAYALGANEFARLIEEGTKGEVVVKVFAGGQLGAGERELLEGLQVGTIDMAVTATGPISNFVENMGVVDLPFLFPTYGDVDRILDGPVGAQAVPMSWGEVYTALQTRVIDGQENPIAIIYAYKMSEVQKFLTLSGHFYSPAPLTMSLRKYNELKPEWQALFREVALKAAAFERALIRDNEKKQLEELERLGMKISTVDEGLFVEAMAPVYERFYERYPAWREIVQQVRKSR